MSKDTYWAIRRREIAKLGAPLVVEEVKVAKPKKAKKAEKAEVVEEVVEEAVEPEFNDADVTVEPA